MAEPGAHSNPIDYIARARQFAPRIAAAAKEIERVREIPESLADELIEQGFYRLLLPRSLGGAELLPPVFVQVIEAIAAVDASTAWCVNQCSGCSMTAAYLEPVAAREVFGNPRGILAWGPGPGEARVVPGGYRVTTTFTFGSGSHNASWLGAHLPIVEADGTARVNSDGSPVIRTLLFPKSAATFTDIWHVMGLRGTGSDQYEVKDLFVPEAHCAARDEDGARREDGLLYRFSSLQLYAGGFAGVAMGIARSVFDSFIELARDKIPRGAKRTLRDNNVVQSQVAQAHARLSAARAYLLSALEGITGEVERTGALTLDRRMVIRLASTFAIHESIRVVDVCYHAAGATAIFESNPFERRFRDMHSVSQQLQGRNEHLETVGQHLMGLEADTAWL